MPAMMENVVLLVVGLATVMVVLAALYGVCVLVSAFFRRSKPAAPAVRPTAPPAGAPIGAAAATSAAPAALAHAAPASDMLAHDLPVILAAVAAAIDRPVRVVSVFAPPHLGGSTWGATTRFGHMGGQRIVWDRVTLAPGPRKSRFRFWQ